MSGVTLHDFGETSCGKSRVMQPLMKGDGVTDPAAQESTLTLTLTLTLVLAQTPTLTLTLALTLALALALALDP